MQSHDDTLRQRVLLAAIGALAGFFMWFVFEYLPDLVGDERLLMLIGVFPGILFGGLLLMVGPLRPVRAAGYACAIAAVSSLLLFWASYRFADLETFLQSIHPVIAYGLLVWLPLPFAMAHETAPRGWRDYEGLFDHAWSNFVRAMAAWIFVCLFLGVLAVSDVLLKLVGLPYLGDLIGHLWFAMPLSGLVLGLALAVLNELDRVVATLRRLALHLFRLLLPPVTVVVFLFVVMLPVQGLGKVFGSFTAAGTMLAMAIGAITLITSTVDARDGDAAGSRLMTIAARVLSLVLPVITAIAVYAIWLRVVQYGWTPTRLSAAVLAILVFLYSLAYGASALSNTGWRARIRLANTVMAVLVVVVSLLWLTPVLNAERISTRSHVLRFKAGKIGVEDLDLWSLGHEWGNPGLAALANMRKISQHEQQAPLAARLAQYDKAKNRWDFSKTQKQSDAVSRAETLGDILPVRPEGAELSGAMLAAIPDPLVRAIIKSCEARLTDGRPRCVAVVGNFDREIRRAAAVLFWQPLVNESGSGTRIGVIEEEIEPGMFQYYNLQSHLGEDLRNRSAARLIAKILDGGFSFGPARINALDVDGSQILPRR